MSLSASVRQLRRQLGIRRSMVGTCPTCDGPAPLGVEEDAEDGPAEDARGVPLCRRCGLPVPGEDLHVARTAAGYAVHTKVIDLRELEA